MFSYPFFNDKDVKVKIIAKNILAAVLLFTLNQSFATDNDMAMHKSLLNMQNQISDLEDKLAAKDGQIDELNYKIKQLETENSSLRAQIEKLNSAPAQNNDVSDTQTAKEQSKFVENGETKEIPFERTSGVGSATAKKVETTKIADAKAQKDEKSSSDGLDKADDKAKKLYNEAYALLNKGQFDKSAKLFSNYVEKYQYNTLTPNAWYWLGQIQYKQNKYQDARISFLNTAKFKGTAKRADALYKLGITSKALGDKAKAKRFFEVLIKTYPTSSSSTLAKKELESLK